MNTVFVVFLFIFSTVSTFAQSEGESVKPIGGITLYRNVSLAAIEQNNYLDVIVKFKAAELGDYFTNSVKEVGKGNALTQIILFKYKDGRGWGMILKERGIY